MEHLSFHKYINYGNIIILHTILIVGANMSLSIKKYICLLKMGVKICFICWLSKNNFFKEIYISRLEAKFISLVFNENGYQLVRHKIFYSDFKISREPNTLKRSSFFYSKVLLLR